MQAKPWIALLGLQLLFAQAPAARAGLIILPGQDNAQDPKACWVFLVPPERLQKSAEVFFSRASLALLNQPGLADAAKRTIDFMELAKHGRLEVAVDEKQAAPLALKDGKFTLSIETAKSLVPASELDPTALVDTGAKIDRGLAAAWLDQLPSGAENAWDDHETHAKWSRAFAHPGEQPAAPPALDTAKALWPRVSEIDARNEKIAQVAALFGAAQRETLELDPSAMTAEGKDSLLLTALLDQGGYREAYLELGARAVNLVAAREAAAKGALKPVEASALVEKLEQSYNSVHVLLARKLAARLIIIPN